MLLPKSIIKSDALFWTLFGLLAALSLALRKGGATPDVSWLMSMCERILDGEVAYIDIFETTPPVPTLLYMPGILLSRASGIGEEAAVFATAYAAAIISLVAAARILPKKIRDAGRSTWVVIAPASLFLFVLANDTFAQREYFAAAFMFPIFAVFIRHAQEGAWPTIEDRLFAAGLAGLSFAIKPPLFALPLIFVAANYLIRTRKIDFLTSSGLIAAGVVGVAVTALSVAAFPAYLGDMTTLMRDVYVPARAETVIALADSAFRGTAVLFGLCLILTLKQKPPAAAGLAMLFAAGFAATYFIQGKYFPYHIAPAALFALVALSVLIWRRAGGAEQAIKATSLLPMVYLAAALIGGYRLYDGFADKFPRLNDLSFAEGLERPTAMAISPNIATSFPLAQHIDAIWVDRIHGQWLAYYTRIMLSRPNLSDAERELYQRYHDGEVRRTRDSIRDKAPELLIVGASGQNRWLIDELLALDPTLLDAYQPIAESPDVRVLRRHVPAPIARSG